MFHVPGLSRLIVGDNTIKVSLSCLDALGEKHVVQSEGTAIKIGS